MKHIIIILLFLSSCFEQDFDESLMIDENRKEECWVIIQQSPKNQLFNGGGDFHIDGKDKDGKECECWSDNRWWVQFQDIMEVGDTFVKLKGTDHFVLCRKKIRIYSFYHKLKGKLYMNNFIDRHYQYDLYETPPIDTNLSISFDDPKRKIPYDIYDIPRIPKIKK
jgi:hypothetical protein